LRNLIQNAVDFAHGQVAIELDWSDGEIWLTIVDDGPGFPVDMLGRIGDPFLRRPGARRRQDPERPGYEGMGLGVFIAKTLLERAGAKTYFSNRGNDTTRALLPGVRNIGAVVKVVWPRNALEVSRADVRGPLGSNERIGR